jgi:hypothetical protein
MTADGLKVAAFDGPSQQGGVFNELAQPAAIGAVKPDVLGLDEKGEIAAIGEAKTAADVFNRHTIRQLKIFGHLRRRRSRDRIRLYVAVPRSATMTLDKTLVFADLAGAENVRRLHVPDVMLRGRFGPR